MTGPSRVAGDAQADTDHALAEIRSGHDKKRNRAGRPMLGPQGWRSPEASVVDRVFYKSPNLVVIQVVVV